MRAKKTLSMHDAIAAVTWLILAHSMATLFLDQVYFYISHCYQVPILLLKNSGIIIILYLCLASAVLASDTCTGSQLSIALFPDQMLPIFLEYSIFPKKNVGIIIYLPLPWRKHAQLWKHYKHCEAPS